MAGPAAMSGIGMGLTALGGLSGAAGAETAAKGKQVDIYGQMLQTVGKAFGFQVQAKQATYQATVEDYQAAVAQKNQQIALGNAAYAADTGEVEASIQGMKTHAQVSTTTAAQGASGLDVNTGSAVAVRSSEIQLGQYNQAQIRASAAKMAYNYQVEASADADQAAAHTYAAGLQRSNAADDMTAAGMTMEAIPLQQQAWSLAGDAGNISAFGSLVGAGASVASKWQQFSQA